MNWLLTRQVTRAWLLLVLLTFVSMIAGHAGAGGLVGSGVVLAATVAKGRWMLMDFLQLRHVPAGWRRLLLLWLVLIAVTAWTCIAFTVLLA